MPSIFNGRIFDDSSSLALPLNRAFKYSDGLFETIRVFNGKIPFLQDHWERLSLGMDLLKFDAPTHFTVDSIKAQIEILTKGKGNWRARLSVWRTGDGFYAPNSNGIEYLIETSPLPTSNFELNQIGLVVGIYDQTALPCPVSLPDISSLKTTAALPQVLAAIHAREKKWDDSLMVNTNGRLACGSSSNIFLVKNQVLFTPPLSEGCKAGTMRKIVLSISEALGMELVEAQLSIGQLNAADEVFLTNAIQGIRWVERMEGIEGVFSNNLAKKLSRCIQEAVVKSLGGLEGSGGLFSLD